MRIHVLAAFLLATLTACGGETPTPQDSSTSETTQGLLSSMPRDASPRQRQIPTDEGSAEADVVEIDVRTLGLDHGDSTAPVQIVEMSDYGCGYCRQFHMQSWPTLKERYIDTGKVYWKFMPYVTGMFQNSLPATEGAECALAQGPGVFGALNDRLWTDQRAWKGASDPHSAVRGMAEEAGVDLEAWDACMASDDRIQRIRAATSLARDLGVRGTPTFFIMGYAPIQGALPTQTFVEILDRAHARAVNEGAEEGGS